MAISGFGTEAAISLVAALSGDEDGLAGGRWDIIEITRCFSALCTGGSIRNVWRGVMAIIRRWRKYNIWRGGGDAHQAAAAGDRATGEYGGRRELGSPLYAYAAALRAVAACCAAAQTARIKWRRGIKKRGINALSAAGAHNLAGYINASLCAVQHQHGRSTIAAWQISAVWRTILCSSRIGNITPLLTPPPLRR